MKDIVERLRHCQQKPMRNIETFPMICGEAADEIERLRAKEAAWEETRRAVAHLNNENAALKRFDRDSPVR